MEVTLDWGLKSLGLILPLQDLGFTQPLGLGFSHLQNKMIPVPFSLLPRVWGGTNEKDVL